MSANAQQLRVLIANEKRDRLELLAQVVIGLGHDVIAREIYVKEVGTSTAREQPDVAIVGLGLSSEHALELIAEIVREASCPVIALLHANDPAYIREAAKRGVFAYIIDGTPDELQSAIDIALQRFSEYHNLQGAFGRRATIEQAKGILMARHSLTAGQAFERLRDHSQGNGRRIVDLAAAIVESHLLLLPDFGAQGVVAAMPPPPAPETLDDQAVDDGFAMGFPPAPARLTLAGPPEPRDRE
jgi:response regulator NasT